jgi:hypothetical protein
VTTPINEALVAYVEKLAHAADRTNHAEDRPQYARHLAATARMFVALHRDPTGRQLKPLVEVERQAYGRSFLSGSEGSESESAFAQFAAAVEAA